MKILVTGGAGFIGGNFVLYMVNQYPEDTIVNLDALTYAGNLETLKSVENKPNYHFVKGDIADRDFIDQLFEKEQFDAVVNFAAERVMWIVVFLIRASLFVPTLWVLKFYWMRVVSLE